MSAERQPPANPAYAFVGALLDELARAGIRDVCLAPGSRSTPLALTAASNPALRCWVHLDERSAAFFALGMARAGGRPVALICTSGTAAANFLPAVVEASLARVPLVVLTADRPHELRDWGAPQTIDQVHLFGRYVRWFVDLPPPAADPALLRYARAVGARAAAAAAGPPAGPVHLNVPLREPLVPVPAPLDGAEVDPAALWGRPGGAPYVRAHPGPGAPDPAAVASLAERLAATRRPLLVAGPLPDPEAGAALASLAAAWEAPLLADPLSGARCGPHPLDAVITAYDAVLRASPARDVLRPDLVLRFGALPTSKPLQQCLEAWRDVPQVLVDPGPVWPDPFHAVGEVVAAEPRPAAQALAAARAGQPAAPHRRGWLDCWRRVDRAARAAIAAALAEAGDTLSEAAVFADLGDVLPPEATLYVGNSMPVRDCDGFLQVRPQPLRVLGNRGANGIDGMVSSVLGAAAAGVGPVVGVIGDLTFLHDAGGLLAGRRFGLAATLVVINNDGGGIFSFLPQAQHAAHFEELFGTPHGLELGPLVRALGARHVQAGGRAAFRRAVARAVEGEDGFTVIEIRTDRAANVAEHRRIWQAVAEALRAELPALSADGDGAGREAGPC